MEEVSENMTRPSEIDDYDELTKKEAEMHERLIVEIEFGKDSKLTPDSQRPTELFNKRENRSCKVLA